MPASNSANAGVVRDFATRAVHMTSRAPSVREAPASPPLWLSSDYLFESVDHYADVLEGRRAGYAYARFESPTADALDQAIAELEGAEMAFSMSSGMSAMATVLLSFVRPRTHFVVHRRIYNTTLTFAQTVLPCLGADVTFVEAESEAVAEAIRPDTAAVVIDVMATPTTRISDLDGVADVCRARGVALVVDSTLATPFLVRPLAVDGVTLTVHSTSKYLSGHADVIGGCVAGSEAAIRSIKALARQIGTVQSPFDAWLTLRGLPTLPLRLARQCTTAARLARELEADARVLAVGFPGLAGHPQHERARRLFGGEHFGAIIALELPGGRAAAARFCDALRLVPVGSGFGSLLSEIRHPASTSHRFMSEPERLDLGIGQGLLRLSVGGEAFDDLAGDLAGALDAL
ncbi:MAG TPA: PLP-dependent transferase [Solirubrobacteraceae bacterium]